MYKTTPNVARSNGYKALHRGRGGMALAALLVLFASCAPCNALPLLGGDKESEESDMLPPRKKLTKQEETNFHQALQNGLIYMRNNNWELARVCFQQCTAIEPREEMPHVYLSTCLANIKQVEAAMMELFTALRINPESLDARFGLGNLLMAAGKWDEAGGQFLQILQKRPDDIPSRGNLAMCLQQEQQIEAAIAQYRYILEKDVKNSPAKLNLAAAYESKKMFDDAAALYKSIITDDPHDAAKCHAIVYTGLAHCMAAKKKWSDALVLYKHAIALTPKNHFAYTGIGKVYEELKQNKLAIENYTKAVGLNPQDKEAQAALKKLLESGNSRALGGSLRVSP